MPALNEATQVGTVESWEEVIVCADAPNTPFMSLLPKAKKTSDNIITSSQVKSYRKPRTTGVPDGQDANNPTSKPRKLIDSCIMKTWQEPAVTDIRQEVDVHSVTDEFAQQIADAMELTKHSIEASCLSANDMNDSEPGLRTRGAYSYLSPTAQATRPVPTGYRPAAQYTGTAANLTETAFKALCQTAYKERRKKVNMLGLVGIEQKELFDTWHSYRTDISGKHGIRSVNQNASDRTFIECVDRLEFSSCTIDLMLSSFLRFALADEAEPVARRDKSGIFIVKDMWSFDYMRAPRVVKLPYLGGGHKAIVDAIFELRCLNPLGQFSAVIDS